MLASWSTSFLVSFLCHLAMDLWNAWQVKATAKDEGRAEAVAEGRAAAAQNVATANQVEAEAGKAHATDQTDAAFDQDFKRG